MRTSAVKEKKDEAGDRATQALRKQLLFQKSPWLPSRALASVTSSKRRTRGSGRHWVWVWEWECGGEREWCQRLTQNLEEVIRGGRAGELLVRVILGAGSTLIKTPRRL
jgi:hypothetical protein